jgi:hypothetical protein
MAVAKKAWFVDRRRGERRSRLYRCVGGDHKVDVPAVMKVDDWMQRHMVACYVMLAIGVPGWLL